MPISRKRKTTPKAKLDSLSYFLYYFFAYLQNWKTAKRYLNSHNWITWNSKWLACVWRETSFHQRLEKIELSKSTANLESESCENTARFNSYDESYTIYWSRPIQFHKNGINFTIPKEIWNHLHGHDPTTTELLSIHLWAKTDRNVDGYISAASTESRI